MDVRKSEKLQKKEKKRQEEEEKKKTKEDEKKKMSETTKEKKEGEKIKQGARKARIMKNGRGGQTTQRSTGQ